MRGLMLLVTVFITLCNAPAIELHSPYAPNFFTIPGHPHWLPDAVSSAMTPGSDSSFYITATTNRVVTPWVLSPGSKNHWDNGVDAWTGSVPQWVDDHWSDAEAILDFDSTPYKQEDWPGCTIDTYGWEQSGFQYDEQATSLGYFVNSEVYRDGSMVAGDYVAAVFTRTISNIVTAVTNLAPHRFTTDLQSSVIHTLDGWAERQYFSTHGAGTPTNDLKSASVVGLSTNRTVASRRITGKTNLWNVAACLLDLSSARWKATPEVWWSSSAFDRIYGPQLPDDISWTTAGLYSLSNSFAVLRGVTNGVAWRINWDQGWLFNDGCFPAMFIWQEYSDYWRGRYEEPARTPEHAFDFAELCATNDYPTCLVNEVTNRTRRLELKTQASVNQAMSELDRTICTAEPTTTTGTNVYTRFVRKFSCSMSYTEAGLHYVPGWESYQADTDLHLRPTEYTNYVEAVTNGWTITGPDDLSDAVEISETVPDVSVEVTYDAGHWSIWSSDLLDALNGGQYRGTPGAEYSIYAESVVSRGDEIDVYVLSTIPGFSRTYTYPYAPTNSRIHVTLSARNGYALNRANPPDYESLNLLPCAQAWAAGSHERVTSCRDVCTASIYTDDDEPSIEMHCAVVSRSYNDGVACVHTNHWYTHRQKLVADVERRRDGSISDPADYVWFGDYAVDPVIDTIIVRSGLYGIGYYGGVSGNIRVTYGNDGWSRTPGSDTAITIGASCSLYPDYDTTLHEIAVKPALSEYCRQRLTNVVDWNWNSIRIQTDE